MELEKIFKKYNTF